MPTLPVKTYFLESFAATPEAVAVWSQRHIDEIKQKFVNVVEGALPPIIFFLAPSPEDPLQIVEGHFPLWMFVRNDDMKEVAAQILPEFFLQAKAFACLTVMEAWIKKNPILAEGPVRDMPGREDALVFLSETFDGSKSQSWTFSRENGKVLYREGIFSDTEAGEGSEGRFCSMLRKAAASRKAHSQA